MTQKIAHPTQLDAAPCGGPHLPDLSLFSKGFVMFRTALAMIATLVLAGSLCAATTQPIKMSKSGICHASDSAWYERTKSFTSFSTIDACMADGGRLPKGHSRSAGAVSQSATRVSGLVYDRDRHFGSWIDEDGDCLNTRHELLESLSTGPVTKQGCRITHGRWNDPYTGIIFLESRHLDVDHLVPLKWAWDHGANTWSRDRRIEFANDPRNLFAVEAGANRQKGAAGPLEWLPPNTAYRCEYVLRFKRITLIWKLQMSPDEKAAIDQLQVSLCGS
jgi:hypothetical protein